jgi:ABC-type Fe3+/spermidine/putrescine transport system ATPase subunit
VGFGLLMHGASDVQAQVREIIQLVGLEGFEKRDVAQLSGGEKQRVALARSLAPRPRFLMLDEPLGSLDAALRTRLVVELRRIIKRVGLTAVYVTHDQQEAFAIGDRVAIMNAGQIEQVDRPEVIYRRPATIFCALFLGLNNIIPVERYHDGLAVTKLGTFALPDHADAILLHPSGLTLTDGADGIGGRVEECVFEGDSYRLKLIHDSGLSLTLRVRANAHPVPSENEHVNIRAEADWVVPLGKSKPSSGSYF